MGHWARSGFHHLAQLSAGPAPLDESLRVEVWLRIPEGATLDVEGSASSLRLPPGSVVDRLDLYRFDGDLWSVTDVRGTTVGPDGRELFHVYRPESAQPHAPLVGWAWARNDVPAEDRATAALADFLADHPQPGVAPRDLPHVIARLRAFNRCARCHAHDSPAAERQRKRDGGPIPNRPTDGAGFYSILGTLQSATPLEYYRPKDMNVGRPFVSFNCGPHPAKLVERGGHRGYVCPSGRVPRLEMDVAAALAAGDAHAKRLCESRRYLRDRMTPRAQAHFNASFAACNL